MEQEAQRLTARFQSVKSRAKFAADHGVPGGGAMVYQHMHAIRPISLEAAKAYARGFGCPLEDISPSLAQKAASAFAVSGNNAPFAANGKTIPKPVVIQDDEWNALSEKQRAFIEKLSLTPLSDGIVDALQSSMTTLIALSQSEQNSSKSQPNPSVNTKRAAHSAISGGDPRTGNINKDKIQPKNNPTEKQRKK